MDNDLRLTLLWLLFPLAAHVGLVIRRTGGDIWDRGNRDVVGWMIFIGHCLKVEHGGEKRLERFKVGRY